MRADLARLREMERAATKGEWSEHLGIILAPSTDGDCPTQAICYAGEEWRHANGLPLYQQATANAALIVALKNQFPTLADRMERMERLLSATAVYLVPFAEGNSSIEIKDETKVAAQELLAEVSQALAEPAQGEKEA